MKRIIFHEIFQKLMFVICNYYLVTIIYETKGDRKMKKKLIAVLVVAFSIIVLINANALAANTWYTCNVVYVGMGTGDYYVKLSDTDSNDDTSPGTVSFTNHWFTIPTTNNKSMLAVVLTAVSMGQTVYVMIDDAGIGTQFFTLGAIFNSVGN